jgi:hypothetical protein
MMMKRTMALTAIPAIFIGLPLLVLGQAPQAETNASVPQTTLSRAVPLVSDTCPVVHAGDSLTLEWNPGFEQPWAVTGVNSITLGFAPLENNDAPVHLRSVFELQGKSVAVNDLTSTNGYFHLEISVSRKIPPGVYRLVNARVRVKVLPNYDGPSPVMTVSPARDRFCITVVRSSTPPSLQPGG